ncbi:MAG: O-methyltransferase, partial [Acidimicrobiia bacterium]
LSSEPTSAEEVRLWVESRMEKRDPFERVARASDEHRAQHGCDVYRSSNGPLLGVLTAAMKPKRILETGCGLGYSALWLAFGSSPNGTVETIEKDSTHAELARKHFDEEGFGSRITVKVGRLQDLLPELRGPYDFVFHDSNIPGGWELEQYARLVRPGGVLATSNLFLGQHDPTIPDLPRGAEYRDLLLNDDRWMTAFAGNWMALSVRK